MLLAASAARWRSLSARSCCSAGGRSRCCAWTACAADTSAAPLLLKIAMLVGTGAAVSGPVALAGAQLLDRWLVTLTGFRSCAPVVCRQAGTTLARVAAAALLATATAVYHAANVDPAAAFDE